MPAARAKIRIFVRLARMPAASAATSELRTARIDRPVVDCSRAWMTAVTTPNTARNSRIWSGSWLKSKGPLLRGQDSMDEVQPGEAERRRPDGPSVAAMADRLVGERHEREEEGGSQRPDRQVHGPETGRWPRDERAQRGGNDHRDDRGQGEVELSVAGDERDVDAPVAVQRPPDGEAAGGDEGGLRQADHSPHAGDHHERQQDDGGGQALGDDGLVVGAGLQERDREPLHREGDQRGDGEGPREAAAPGRQPASVVVGWRAVGDRSGAAACGLGRRSGRGR